MRCVVHQSCEFVNFQITVPARLTVTLTVIIFTTLATAMDWQEQSVDFAVGVGKYLTSQGDYQLSRRNDHFHRHPSQDVLMP